VRFGTTRSSGIASAIAWLPASFGSRWSPESNAGSSRLGCAGSNPTSRRYPSPGCTSFSTSAADVPPAVVTLTEPYPCTGSVMFTSALSMEPLLGL